MVRKICLITSLALSLNLYAQESCSRTATVNNQEILIDVNSNAKGEGLRYYLERDQKAKELLNKYQDANRNTNKFAYLGTAGVAMLIGGAAQSNENRSGLTGRNTLIGLGVTMIVVNFLVSRTIEYTNERLLQESINEYNKRNLPRIYFLPYKNQQSSIFSKPKSDSGLLAGLTFSF